MDLNELQGKVLRVNLARPSKIPVQGLGNRASASPSPFAVVVPVSPNHPCSLGVRGLAQAVRKAAGKERWYVSSCVRRYAAADGAVVRRCCAPCPNVGYLSRTTRICRRRSRGRRRRRERDAGVKSVMRIDYYGLGLSGEASRSADIMRPCESFRSAAPRYARIAQRPRDRRRPPWLITTPSAG